MTRLLHISDLHFGAVNARLLEPLLALARHLQPDAIIVSGDLAQRARPGFKPRDEISGAGDISRAHLA